MATNPDDIRLSDEHRRLLADLADQKGESWTEVLDTVICAARADGNGAGDRVESKSAESLYEKIARTGAIGMVKDGPSDVSTNPKYMEGFGEDG